MAETIRIDVETGDGIQNLRDMRNELRDLRGQMATAEGEEFQKLSQRASEVNADIARMNSTITDSGSSFTNFNTLLARTGKSLLTLDFGQAAEQAQALQLVASKMNFKTLTKGIGQAGKAIGGLGKALLANPLFLIAGVVIGIISAMDAWDDVIHVLKSALDILMAPLNLLIEGLKSLTDWLGITSHAEDKLAEDAKKAAEIRENAHRRARIAIVGDLQREIALMQAQGAEIEEIENKQIELSTIQLEAHRQEMERLQAELWAKKQMGIVNDELLDQIAQQAEATKNAANDLKILRENISKNRAKREEEDKNESIKRAQERAKAIQEIEERSSKFILDLKRKTEDIEAQSIDDEIERQEKLNQLKRERLLEDMELAEEGTELRAKQDAFIAAETERMENQISEMKERKRMEEKQSILEHNRSLQDIEDGVRDREIERIEDDFERAQARRDFKLEQARNDRERELEDLQTQLDNEEITEEEFRRRKELLEAEHADKLDQIDQNLADAKERRRKDEEQSILESQQFARDEATHLFGTLANLAEEGSAQQKALALASILASQGQAIAGGIQIATQAASAGGPAAPFIFAGVAASILGSVASTIGQAKSILNSAPGASPVGGGGTGPTTVAVQAEPRQPSFSNFNDELAGDIQGGQSVEPSGTYILESELSDREERKAQINRKKNL